MRFFRNWQGKMRVLALVNIVRLCWIPKMIKRTAEMTKSAMVWPLPHGKRAPPKLMAIISVMMAPIDVEGPSPCCA